MNRLTKYEPRTNSMFPYKLKDEELSTKLDSIHKLGLLEDVEEEIGIDLITLFKALKNGIWYYDDYGQLLHEYVWWVSNYLTVETHDKISSSFMTIYENQILSFADYGKTWALTKEELL